MHVAVVVAVIAPSHVVFLAFCLYKSQFDFPATGDAKRQCECFRYENKMPPLSVFGVHPSLHVGRFSTFPDFALAQQSRGVQALFRQQTK